MGYVRSSDTWILKSDTEGNCTPLFSIIKPSPFDIPSSFPPIPPSQLYRMLFEDILTKLHKMDGKCESIQDLLLTQTQSSHKGDKCIFG